MGGGRRDKKKCGWGNKVNNIREEEIYLGGG